MSNAFYDAGDQRAAKVNNLFAAIARRYDLINDLQTFGLHRLWKRRVVKLAQIKQGNRALDLCCGTGDLALALAQYGANTTGLDFSQPMLDVAARRQCSLAPQIPDLNFIQADAQQIPFPENSFDIVTIGYGLRNLTSWERGLDEMFRVARPGARLIVLDFGKPANSLWRDALFHSSEAVRSAHRTAFLRQRLGLRLHFGIAQALSGATGRGGKDARTEAGERSRH